jgi:hypothetical protein
MKEFDVDPAVLGDGESGLSLFSLLGIWFAHHST